MSVENAQPRSIEQLLELSIPSCREWLDSESPVKNATDDWLQGTLRAKRVLQALQKRRGDKAGDYYQTVVIQGPFGSGKSSIVELLMSQSHKERLNLIFVSVNCWGFSSVAAQEHILEKAIEVLGKHVDSLSLRRLPHAYALAIQQSPGWLRAMIGLLDHQREPVEVLKQFTPILCAINARLVIVIEDTDRNDKDFDQKQIEAMLFRFRAVERISFILTAGEKSEIDFTKIAEVIEPIEILDPQLCSILSAKVLNHCLDSQVWGYFTPSQWWPDEIRERASEREHDPSPGLRAIASLIRTPREMKSVLRDFYCYWETLKGEVEVYDLLAILTLKHCVSSVFGFIVLYHREFAFYSNDVPTDQNGPEGGHPVHFAAQLLQEAINKCSLNHQHLAVVLEHILPPSLLPEQTDIGFEKVLEREIARLTWPRASKQSVRSARGLIYWQRLLSRSFDHKTPNDQKVLNLIQDSIQHQNFEALAVQCANSQEYRGAVVHFSDCPLQRDHTIARKFACAVLHQAQPFQVSSRSGVNEVFEWVMNWLPSTDDRSSEATVEQAWFTHEIHRAMEIDLDDAICLYNWAENHTDELWLSKLRDEVLERLKLLWCERNRRFTSLFRAGFNNTFSFIIRDVAKLNLNGVVSDQTVEWMYPLIIRDLKLDRLGMSYQLHSAFRIRDRQGIQFDVPALKSFFGNQWMTVLQMIEETASNDGRLAEQDRERHERIREAARQCLAEAQVDVSMEIPTIGSANHSG